MVSDGAGSASLGGQGAWIVCRELSRRLRGWCAGNETPPSDALVEGWMDDLRDRLGTIAERRGVERREFAATLVGLAVVGNEALLMHVGDGAVVGRRSGVWEVLSGPENGEYASTTFFVTDDPEVRLRLRRLPREHDAFALFSDGIEDLALQQTGRQAHPRFFDPMMKPIDQSDRAGHLGKLSAALGGYLDSAAVCERTDDDKTLILASRA